MTSSVANTRCSFIAILGQPNAGKSTLINQLVGQKISIVSKKVQTTRQRILGIAIEQDAQLVLIDTPGIFKPRQRLDRAMVGAAWSAGKDADAIVLIHDAATKRPDATIEILKALAPQPVILVLNKIDQLAKEKLLALAAQFGIIENIAKVFMISALKGDGVQDLRQHLATTALPGPWMFPEDQLCDMPQRLWAAEITREQLYNQLHEELPYATYVETENWEEFDNGSVKIHQVIYVARDTQKSIVLGKKGHQIKAISTAAREELSQLLERQVHLFLHVKVAEGWHDRPAAYRLMGLEFNS